MFKTKHLVIGVGLAVIGYYLGKKAGTAIATSPAGLNAANAGAATPGVTPPGTLNLG